MYRYLGQVQAFAFNYEPHYWSICDGKILDIRANYALFILIGAAFGGDGKTTFALPDIPANSAGFNYYMCMLGGFPPKI